MMDGCEHRDAGGLFRLGRFVPFLYGVQVVGGSNPLALTKEIKALQAML